MYDLPRVRWVAAALVTLMAPLISFILLWVSTVDSEDSVSRGLLAGNWWLSWLAAAIYTFVLILFYNVDLVTSSRKDALVPAKRHSSALLIALPPVVIVYELWLSSAALGR